MQPYTICFLPDDYTSSLLSPSNCTPINLHMTVYLPGLPIAAAVGLLWVLSTASVIREHHRFSCYLLHWYLFIPCHLSDIGEASLCLQLIFPAMITLLRASRAASADLLPKPSRCRCSLLGLSQSWATDRCSLSNNASSW